VTNLGSSYTDTATGYVGTATAYMEELGGKATVRLERLDNNGKTESVWFTESRLTISTETQILGFGNTTQGE
jgi:hypothetical protein